MKLVIKDIKDKYKGKKAIVIGHGPSLNNNLNKIKLYKDLGYVILGCNNWYEFYPGSPPHYWVSVNNVDYCVNMLPYINKYKSVWVYADSVDRTDQGWLEKNIQTDFLPYDQRHHNGQKCHVCDTKGCPYRDPSRLTVQEELMDYTGSKQRYGSGHTVVLHALSFAVIMGFSEVFCTGLDFNYRLGYAKNNSGRKVPSGEGNYFDVDKWGGDIYKDIEVIKKSAALVNTSIYNTNKGSVWKNFEYKEVPEEGV